MFCTGSSSSELANRSLSTSSTFDESTFSNWLDMTDENWGNKSRISSRSGWKSSCTELCSRICSTREYDETSLASLATLNGL
ncbi:hypothetical protein OGATHE_000709 [Ogataea polymorpha]|uniref:Uncharacterized protein n=1 Tax=Ogataea polymorpha TaxID=460523 RepID=A0A9P8PVB2_9ASCO|nr:hypothetical protein OGATHE_000709 [Ogataea polymorpha]